MAYAKGTEVPVSEPRLSDERLSQLLRASEDAGLPWCLVGKPWMADDQVDTYAISGSSDPHLGKAVIQWCEVDEVSVAAEEDGDAAWAKAEAEQRSYLAYALAAANALPDLIADLVEAREALAGVQAWSRRP